MEAAGATVSLVMELTGTNLSILGEAPDIDMGANCLCIRISKTFTRGSGTYCSAETIIFYETE